MVFDRNREKKDSPVFSNRKQGSGGRNGARRRRLGGGCIQKLLGGVGSSLAAPELNGGGRKLLWVLGSETGEKGHLGASVEPGRKGLEPKGDKRRRRRG